MAGAEFVLDCAQRRAPGRDKEKEETETEEEKRMKVLLDWARLVCAHHGIEVSS